MGNSRTHIHNWRFDIAFWHINGEKMSRRHRKGSNISVRVRGREPADRLIKRFLRKVKKQGLIEEVKRKAYYLKPSEKRRLRNIKKKRDIAKAKAKEKQNK